MSKKRRRKIINYRQMLVAEIWETDPEITQQEIADRLANEHGIEVTQRTISRDLNALRRAHWQKSTRAMGALKDKLLGEYELLYGEAFAAWLDSLENKETFSLEKTKGGDEVDGKATKVKKRTEGQSGNPALLAQAQAALKAIREMFGIDEATQLDIDASDDLKEWLAALRGKDE